MTEAVPSLCVPMLKRGSNVNEGAGGSGRSEELKWEDETRGDKVQRSGGEEKETVTRKKPGVPEKETPGDDQRSSPKTSAGRVEKRPGGTTIRSRVWGCHLGKWEGMSGDQNED
ncbi:hypothetical protein NDU88_001635 [Pleurodeles waltl]|uniref:Uncharacterized protein n=1 Tax=Pleurodeles waltl TaxID=8319 RepID=A0AAV7WN12_PLEWA|nr:hypothetical protein NDU88_001635 [Pleurodeles waltl]